MKSPDSSTPMLKVSGLTVRLRGARGEPGRAVVQDVSFDVRAGETVCVVGESGSGKSVTSMTAMGLIDRAALYPAAGSIEVDGEDVLQASPARMRALRASTLSMIFQEPMTALNPVQPVGRQIDEVLRLHTSLDRRQRRERVLAMMASVHLPDIERIYRSYPHQLSGGQRQRIVIAMALILGPKVLVADEPTTALDVTTQKQILTLIRELQMKHGTAVVFITHDFGVVAEIADRIVVMNAGRVVETGSRDQILAEPREAYTRMLVSSVPSLIPQARDAVADKTILSVRGLGKHYGGHGLSSGLARLLKRSGKGQDGVQAAQDISFSLRHGEILGVVGESGSGKSTVARCVAQLIAPSSGTIRLHGQDLAGLAGNELAALRKRIQIVFQDPYRSLNPRRRVGDSIIEGLLNYGMPQAAAMAKAAEALNLVGLQPDALQRYPHQFSGGQRQRICIARALVMEPDVLIADEAVSALDVSVQAQVLELLESVRRKVGVGVLFITHDLRVAAQICDTLVVMQHGRIVEAGAARDVLARPTNGYTQALIAAAPGRHWDFQHFQPVAQAA
ncbi:ABC transporter ATP-binding protein [Bordetella sp. N]|uniref:dipeptide ABC transporter ATP-binding protein n=1 Tax=Bordetella sp. N TaxID=1746199 RepID=UPI00070C61FD|nr:ABC transporter ATP-binding protein [Bordetella sp. N]ALM81743.1 microcin ABC transporter ATP-binding protein [Bordetella sp. N]